MENYDWTLSIRYGENPLEFRWREHYGSHGQPMGHYGFIYEAHTPDEPSTREYSFEAESEWLNSAIRKAASSFRRTELQQEIDRNGFEWIQSEELKKAKILELFERSEAGEYLGQSTSNQNIYVQDIAAILDLGFGHTRDLVDELVAQGKVGLSGMILISNEHYEDSFRYWEDKTGHRRLTVGDWGPWGCQACGQTGDEYEDPSDYPCVTPAEREQVEESPVVDSSTHQGAERV